jgi:eukaryotic-like serine/threonine-protein kinase
VELTLQSMKTLSDLIDQALALEGDARTQWLDELSCGPHAALSPIVEEMLSKRAEMSTHFLSRTPHIARLADASSVANALPRLEPNAQMGGYTLVRELGRGGMGVVWLAERSDGQLKRQIALKLPMLSASEALAERFVRERNILSKLEHPNIARLYDAGVSAAGQPYLALEYVAGEPITTHCDRKRLSIPERLQRFLDVARAVQYAHANLIVHRDLKPNNILVSEEGAVRLLDFGIAKLLDDSQSAANETELTLMSGRALTLDYASPEQVQGSAIGTASDVYSLGVILYQLLCGLKPYSIGREHKFSAEKILQEIQVIAPSQRAASDFVVVDSVEPTQDRPGGTMGRADLRAQARRTSPERLARTLAGDLDTIVAKAMRKVLTERYATVAEFAADIERYMHGLPVLAQPESWRYRTGKFIRRNRIIVGAGTAVACAVVAGLGVALWQANVAREAAHRADREAAMARAQQLRADGEAQAAKREGARADSESRAARLAAENATVQATRADEQALVAKQLAVRAERESALARDAAARADREAAVARRENERGNAVQAFLVDLFSANSNDQKNAIQVRNLTAKQLLDRGAEKLESGTTFSGQVNALLYRQFGELYETVYDYERAIQMHERSVAAASAAFGEESKEFALALMELAWVKNDHYKNSDLTLIEKAKAILKRIAPRSEAYAQALYFEANFVNLRDPRRAERTAKESIALLKEFGTNGRRLAFAERSLAFAQRALGNCEAGVESFAAAAASFTALYGADAMEVGVTRDLSSECYRQLLQFAEAETQSRAAVEILRPFRGSRVDSDHTGLRLLRVMYERGRFREALSLAHEVEQRLDVENAEPEARMRVMLFLSELALAKGDIANAEKPLLSLHSMPNVAVAGLLRATVVLRLARIALIRGDVERAGKQLADARVIRAATGFPIEFEQAFVGLSAELSARQGDGETAQKYFRDFQARYADQQTSPSTRFAIDIAKARVQAALSQWQLVKSTLAPWLSSSALPLPFSARAESLLLAAESSSQLGETCCAEWLLEAGKLLRAHDAPDSPRLVRLALLEQTRKSSSSTK